jgi:3-phytase
MRRLILLCPALLLVASSSLALDILLTNDDGFDSQGITALRTALVDAGHNVTVVAPAGEQSGKGGSLNTGVFDFTVGGGTMPLVHHGGGLWSLDGTPSDCIAAGLDIVLKDNPPDLVVSGHNRGQNIGKPGSNGSGTIGAALRATFAGFPAIATSVGIDIGEGSPFPSTLAAFAPASDFIVDVIAALEAAPGADLMPNRVRLLNINFPVPYEAITGVAITKLADGTDLELPLFDPSQGFPSFGIPPLPFPTCADAAVGGGACFATVGLGFGSTPDEESNSDLDAQRGNLISITPMDADMSAGNKAEDDLAGVLGGLSP